MASSLSFAATGASASCTMREQQVNLVTLGQSSSAVCIKKQLHASLQICRAVPVAETSTLETVQKVIATQLSVDEVDVKPQSKFSDLGADSLDTVEIMMNLEESFKISLGEEGAEKITTVQDAADLIQGLLSKS